MKRLFLCIVFTLCANVLFAQRVAVSKATPKENYEKGVENISSGNTQKGLQLIRLAAAGGHTEAVLSLASYYEEGKYVKQDYTEAAHWYGIAAKHGDANAIKKLQAFTAAGKIKPEQKSDGKGQNVVVQQITVPATTQPASDIDIPKAEPKSDVDVNMPTTDVENKNTIVIIIANENYQEESKVEFALRDGRSFKEYCQKALGIPEKHIHLREDATLNNLLTEIDWLQKLFATPAYKDKASVIFYYAGHGIPDEASGKAYLLPVDGKGNMIITAYSLANLYKTFEELPAKRVLVLTDACFSGAKRGEGMLASARGVAIKAKEAATSKKVIAFSAATGDETAYPYKEQGHGLFTYFLLKGIKESKGACTLGELFGFVSDNVSSASILENGKSQTPTVNSPTAEWKQEKLLVE